jgi:hypothetical protein
MADEKDDRSETMKCLGQIMGKIDAIEKSNSRTIYALIGVIAAQIGVKVLGTDPLLDIATALALFGCALLLGFLITGIRLIKNGKRRMTGTGKWLAILVVSIISTQICVYFRDLGCLEPRIIYAVRIMQNLVMIIFAWKLMNNADIFISRDIEKEKTNVE